MYHCREKKVIRCLYAEKDLSYLKMTAAAHREELGKSLQQSQKHSLKPLHTLILENLHDSHNLDDDTEDDDDRGRHHAAEIEHCIVEHLRIVASASGHEDVT